MTVVGPLTTTFRAPSSCTTTSPQVYQIWSASHSRYVEGPLFTSGSIDCFPSGYDPAPTNYYSPGWCPHGYTTACSSLASARRTTETAVICCPTNFRYTCRASALSNGHSIGCTTAWTNAMAVLGVTVVKNGEVRTTTVVSETSNAITAYGIQVRFKSNDPTPTSSDDDPAFFAASRTLSPTASNSTHLLVPTQPPSSSSFSSSATSFSSSSSSSGGVSTSAAIGIGLGSAAAALLLAGAIGLFFFLRWRRKKGLKKAPSDIPPPVPPKDKFPPSSSSTFPHRTVPPPYELSEEAASPRRRSMSISKQRLSFSPATGTAPTTLGGLRDSGVLAGQEAAELEVPGTMTVRDRATPESERSEWTDRHARAGNMAMPWI
ncbi:uncharacterized protein P884DRAFT_275548 [Thermothelomyces heterothallicus CBS 202.75]|uniref:uncharacterized protein n=1 Tax=Thermothelomyces heterothallicus CBS 202.75 TaxID=1149848 RepID=UPI0037434F2D